MRSRLLGKADRTIWLLLTLLAASLGACSAAGVALWDAHMAPVAHPQLGPAVVLTIPTLPLLPTAPSSPERLAPPTTIPAGSITPTATTPVGGTAAATAAPIIATASTIGAASEGDRVREALKSVVRVRTNQGSGTGFMARRRGDEALFVTNAHVVGANDEVSIIAPNGTEHTGQVVSRDEAIDLAVIAVGPLRELPLLQLGRAASMRLGDPLYVVGFALGGELLGDPTVTRGVVSGRRMLRQVDYLQTDAAMNPGVSGGPVVNSAGEVIGVATWGIRDVGGRPIEGINFAVPAELVRDLVERLVT